MAKKREVSEAALKKVAELQAAAVAAQEAATEAHDKNIEADRAYKSKLNDLRVKIATGDYTTDNDLLDINIVVNGSVEKDGRYDAKVRFEKSLQPHARELVAQIHDYAGTPHIDKMGLLPESPKLQLSVGAAFGRGVVLGGDASVQCVLPVVERSGVVSDLLVPHDGGTRDEPTFGSNIVFEDKLQWILENQPNMNIAVALWSNSQILDRPLSAPQRVTAEIMVRREERALELKKLMGTLISELGDLKKAQETPSSWKRTQIKLEGPQAVVSFASEVNSIKQARRNLGQKVREAELLGMGNGPVSSIYEDAVELLEDTKEWDS